MSPPEQRRRSSLRSQLILGSVGVVLAIFTALGLLLAAFFGHYFTGGRVATVTRRAHVLARLWPPSDAQVRQRVLRLVAVEGGHAWVVSAGGALLAQFGKAGYGPYADWVTATDLADVLDGRTVARTLSTGQGDARLTYAVVAVPLPRTPRRPPGRGVVLWAAPVGGQALLRGVTARVGLVAGLSLLLAAALFAWLAGRLTGPIRHLQGAAEQIASGHFQVPIREQGPEEVRSLARSLRAMCGQLSDLDRTRREFMADVSHDLRSPLAAVRAALEGLRSGTAGPAERERYLALASGEAARLGRLVDDLLAVARADAGRLDLRRRRVDLKEAMLRVALSLEAEAQTRGVVLGFELPDGAVEIDADPDRLSQVLWNVMDNAVRHAPPGSHVGVRLTTGLLEVRNPGPVIQPEVAARLFERFERGGGGSAGSGLGLAIARTLVEAHGGTIDAEAPASGGLVVRVRWPPPA